MVRIIDFSGQEVVRAVTVASLLESKSNSSSLAQVTASSAEEAAAAEVAGVEMLVCMADCISEVRKGSSFSFVTAAIDFSGAVSADDLLRVAYDALANGADAVITSRSAKYVRPLAKEGIPVMGHLGFIPRQSTWYGGVRAVGKTAREAKRIWDGFRELEDAGAFAVECELMPARVMGEINKRTTLATVSLGSGGDADVIFLFTADLCGETQRTLRHARKYGNIGKLRQKINDERITALQLFRADVAAKRFPDKSEIAEINPEEFRQFVQLLDEIDSADESDRR